MLLQPPQALEGCLGRERETRRQACVRMVMHGQCFMATAGCDKGNEWAPASFDSGGTKGAWNCFGSLTWEGSKPRASGASMHTTSVQGSSSGMITTHEFTTTHLHNTSLQKYSQAWCQPPTWFRDRNGPQSDCGRGAHKRPGSGMGGLGQVVRPLLLLLQLLTLLLPIVAPATPFVVLLVCTGSRPRVSA